MDLKIEKNLQVTMRDGVKLATDVYRPAGTSILPVILMRLPYNKEIPLLLFLSGDILRIAQAGFAVVVQDCRGTFKSEGEFDPYFQEAEDGADAIAWAAKQKWSDGNVGMMGASYYGATQWLAACENPSALKAIAPFITTDQYYDMWTYQGGAFQLGFMLQWSTATFGIGEVSRRLQRGEANGEQFSEAVASADKVSDRYWHLPIADQPHLTDLTPYYSEWVAHPDYDDYWRQSAPRERYDSINVPALNFGGWYDLFLGGTLANYRNLKNRLEQRLIVGPWSHGYNGAVYPDRDFGMHASDNGADVTSEQIRWFNRWLKKEDTKPEPKVKLFIMGPDVWREESDWPLPDTTWQKFYLHSNGDAAANTGKLDLNPPAKESADVFRYDPADPAPTVGGASFLPGLFIGANAGPRDQRIVESREDVLCYSTASLESDTEVTGPVRLILYVRSSALDTDFTGKLVDVYPDGRAIILTDGILRARYRDSFSSPQLLTPGRVYQLEIDLVATANVFASGHRIRLEISSSNFPRFDRNTNSGGIIAHEAEDDFIIATNEILHDNEHPSHLVLPVIERG